MIKRIKKQQIFLGIFFLLFGIFLYWLNTYHISPYKVINSSNLAYEKAKVVEITDSYLEKDSDVDSGYRGTQNLKLEILTGKHQGKLVTSVNTLTRSHNIFAKAGKTLIVCIDETDVTNHVSVYNYSRSTSLYILVFIFLALLVIVGDIKGVKSAISLIFTLACIIFFTVPTIFNGYSPILISIITIIMISAITLLLVDGYTKKTFVAFCGSAGGVICAGIIFMFSSKILHISGYNLEEVEPIFLVSVQTGLQLKYVLFAGVLIAAVGAVLDVAMSIASTLQELYDQNPKISTKQLYRSGLNVGRDMIGTMSNTLILAYAGGSFGTMILMMAYSVNYQQVINMDSLVIEIAQALAGSMGIILTVPIVAWLGSRILTEKSFLNFIRKDKNNCSG